MNNSSVWMSRMVTWGIIIPKPSSKEYVYKSLLFPLVKFEEVDAFDISAHVYSSIVLLTYLC